MKRFFSACFAVAILAPAITSPAQSGNPSEASANAVQALVAWLGTPLESRAPMAEASFASVALSKTDAARASRLLWEEHVKEIRRSRQQEFADKIVEAAGVKMKYGTVNFDQTPPPPGGRSLFISLHGGGGTAPAVNESQWVNQVKLAKAYHPQEGIYVAPRAPTDTWDLWHRAPMDQLLERLIENFVVFENVNPNRVFLLGYSAGGDGVYQLGPRMADRWAAVSMMAGHPNDASPLGLRNIGFSLHVGANDAAYNRNKIGAEWGQKLDALQQADPKGYAHFVQVHEGKGHWMDLEDRAAIPWMEKFTRNPLPEKVVWHQDDVTHSRFYWLAVPTGKAREGQEVTAQLQPHRVEVAADPSVPVLVRVNDAMLDLNEPVTISRNGTSVFQGAVTRTIRSLATTLQEYGDPDLMFSAELSADLPSR